MIFKMSFKFLVKYGYKEINLHEFTYNYKMSNINIFPVIFYGDLWLLIVTCQLELIINS